MKRFALIIAAVLTLGVFLTACDNGNGNSAKRKAEGTQNSLVLQQQQALGALVQTQPAYFPPFSDERRNINERTARFADPAAVSYITVLTQQGGILYTGTVKGKVSSVDSEVTPADGVDCVHHGANDPRPDGCGTVQIVEPDGSWGTNNPAAVFWFDDKNAYHETVMPYFVSTTPQVFATPPILTINAPAQAIANKCDAQGNNCHG